MKKRIISTIVEAIKKIPPVLGRVRVGIRQHSSQPSLIKGGVLAFTLAEVLITLGVIGIVASITYTSFIYKYQMKVFEIRFKKNYSLLMNTINYLQVEDNIKCHLSRTSQEYVFSYSDCEFLKANLIQKLNLTKMDNNIVNLYKKKDDVLNEGGSFRNVHVYYNEMINYNNTEAYQFNDGSVLITHKNNPSPAYQVYYVIDVNGRKKPNKWGYDVFYLTLMLDGRKNWIDTVGNGKITISDELAAIKEKGGKFPSEILQNN